MAKADSGSSGAAVGAGLLKDDETLAIEFIDLILDHPTERGVIDPRRLYESPFTDLDDHVGYGMQAT